MTQTPPLSLEEGLKEILNDLIRVLKQEPLKQEAHWVKLKYEKDDIAYKMALRQTKSLIKTVCEEVISPDEDYGPVEVHEATRMDYMKEYANELRASQRTRLKDIISGKIKL